MFRARLEWATERQQLVERLGEMSADLDRSIDGPTRGK